MPSSVDCDAVETVEGRLAMASSVLCRWHASLRSNDSAWLAMVAMRERMSSCRDCDSDADAAADDDDDDDAVADDDDAVDDDDDDAVADADDDATSITSEMQLDAKC
jgi:hypothetical protein